MSETVRLIGGIGSPFSHRASVAMRLKGVPYELILEHLSNKSDLLLKHNPVHKLVPVLHGGHSAAESLVIVEYVDEAFDGPPLLPANPYERAEARFWAQFIGQKVVDPSIHRSFSCAPAVCKAVLDVILDGDGEQRAFVKEAKANLALLEAQLKGRRFFGGAAIGFLDIAACGLAHWVGVIEEVTGVTLLNDEELPALCEWANGYVNDETVKQCLRSRDDLVAYFSARKEMHTARARATLHK
ncbi:putative glutathione S-transferase [Panicum miliaceum]|uniref:glutathione transferase n=1 Tax=Panicum miliaceum TaxID=4540 RepID=A0A3L6SH13_PANMI|nr:putative glutathione S-transferase [Panicum miliaceum]